MWRWGWGWTGGMTPILEFLLEYTIPIKEPEYIHIHIRAVDPEPTRHHVHPTHPPPPPPPNNNPNPTPNNRVPHIPFKENPRTILGALQQSLVLQPYPPWPIRT